MRRLAALLDIKAVAAQALVVLADDVLAGILAALDYARIARLARFCERWMGDIWGLLWRIPVVQRPNQHEN